MCDPVTIGTTLVSMAASRMMAPKAPNMPAPTTPTKPPQSAQAPDQTAVRRSAAGNAAGGPAVAQNTWLTGMGGVNPGGLNLGRNILLGA